MFDEFLGRGFAGSHARLGEIVGALHGLHIRRIRDFDGAVDINCMRGLAVVLDAAEVAFMNEVVRSATAADVDEHLTGLVVLSCRVFDFL